MTALARARSLGRLPRPRSLASLVPLLVLAVGASLTVFATVQLRRDVNRAAAEQLSQRARSTTNLFSTVTQGVAAVLTTGGVLAESTGGDLQAFKRGVGPRLAPTLLSNAVLFERSGAAIRELAWVGSAKPRLVPGLTAAERRLILRADATGRTLVAAHGRRAGANVIGIATAAHAGSRYVVYGEISVPRAVSFGNLKGVDFAFYIGKESPTTLLATNARRLPIGGRRLVVHLTSTGLAQQPVLVYGESTGVTLASLGPWILLGVGLFTSLALAGMFEAMRRRRDVALQQAAINRHQALHDALTDLPNRTLFRDRIEQALLRGRRSGELAAVILVDLDRFKEVNDTLGHQSGDRLLQTLSVRLAGTVRATDTVARLGGDEFGVLAGAVSGVEDARLVAAKLRSALSGPVDVGGLAIEVDASIGIALFPEHGDDVDSLMRHADVALYRSKAMHEPVVYSSDDDHYSPARLQLAADLRRAVERDELIVHYQPQASASGEICSVEALVRWQHPEFGLVRPDRFIALAENTGMIRPITRFVLDTALMQCRAWLDRGWRIGVAVNVGARDLLDAGFPDEVSASLERAGVAPELLELEITEDTIFTDAVRAYAVISGLHERGVHFAIDDFGAGQSSLSYLKRLPVQVLKIDKSFVLGMADNPDDAVIVRSTIDLGHNLRLRVIAEGVETREIRARLAALGCDMVQGFELGHPLPAAEVEKLFGSSPAQRAKAPRPAPRPLIEPA